MNPISFLTQMLRISVPYLFAASGGVIAERGGIISLALEGSSWLVAMREFAQLKGELGWWAAFRRSKDPTTFVVLFEDSKHIADRQSVVALIAFLRRISRSIALVLLMRSDAKREFDKHLLPREMFGERICHLPGQAYANQIELLRNAVCVLTDSRDCFEEATALSTPCLAIGVRAGPAGLAPGGTATIGAKARAAAWATWPCGDDGDLPAPQDGLSGARIAEHLCTWLRHPKVRPPAL